MPRATGPGTETPLLPGHKPEGRDALSDFLADAKLGAFEAKIRMADCVEPEDLNMVEDATLRSVGMNDIQIMRLRRKLPQRGSLPVVRAVPLESAQKRVKKKKIPLGGRDNALRNDAAPPRLGAALMGGLVLRARPDPEAPPDGGDPRSSLPGGSGSSAPAGPGGSLGSSSRGPPFLDGFPFL